MAQGAVPPHLQVGAKVEAMWNGEAEYYGGVITKRHRDGTINIEYDDGDAEQRIGPDLIRPAGVDEGEDDEGDDEGDEESDEGLDEESDEGLDEESDPGLDEDVDEGDDGGDGEGDEGTDEGDDVGDEGINEGDDEGDDEGDERFDQATVVTSSSKPAVVSCQVPKSGSAQPNPPSTAQGVLPMAHLRRLDGVASLQHVYVDPQFVW